LDTGLLPPRQLFFDQYQILFDWPQLLFEISGVMTDDSLTKVMAELESRIGAERLSMLRRHAASKGVSIFTLLGEAVNLYVDKLPTKEAA
jgi:hypothetical protein